MDESEYKPRNTIILAIIVFFVDAFVMNQGLIAVFCLFCVVFFGVPMSAFSMFKKQKPNVALIQSLIFGVMAISVLGANTLNNRIAKSRAETIIQAVEQFHQDTSQYPETLEDLVPQYIPEVPVAKYALGFNIFYYVKDDRDGHNDATLLYVDLPPFGRPTYGFKSKSWGYLD